MNPTRFAVEHRTTTIAMVLVAMLLGYGTFQSMPRREDPELTIRAAVILTQWPGATAEKIEELVTDPIETAVNQMDQVDIITSLSKVGQSVITVELLETLPQREVDQAWDEMRAKVMEAAAQLPDGCGAPWVNSGFGDVFAVCLALYQVPSADPNAPRYGDRELEILADQVENELKTIDAVAKVEKHGVQEEAIYLEVDSADWAKITLTADALAQLLQAQNIVAPGGQIDTGDSRYGVRPTGEFEGTEAMRDVVVGRRDGALPVYLRDLPLTIRRGYVEPARTRYRYVEPAHRGPRAVLLAVSMKSGENVVQMGRSIERVIASMKQSRLPYDVEVRVVNDLPRQVGTLVSNFTTNLWQAILIVLAVAFLMMGWRPAVIMATAVPLSMIAAMSIVRMFGVELEQFSIASLIIALGMIVDNAIVVSDNGVRLIRAGMPRKQAVIEGATSLAVPIITSTLTTVAAFLPMLTIVGNVGEYVRSLPIVVATTLLVSYAVAMLVTPIMCYWLLRPSGPERANRKTLLRCVLERLLRRRTPAEAAAAVPAPRASRYDGLMRWCLEHKGRTLGVAAAAVVGSVALVPLIGNQFFPQGDRDQFFVHVWLPEGASIEATERVCARVEDLLVETSPITKDGASVERLKNAITMVGTGGPRLMLTSSPEQNYPNYAHLVVNTTDPTLSAPWVEELRGRVATIPGALIDVQRFTLGPYVKNPVEIRLVADDAVLLRRKAEELLAVFRETPGTLNPSSNWKNPSYEVELRIDPKAANLAGVTNLDVAGTLNGLITGRRLTTYREGDHLVPVYLRWSARGGERLEDLSGVYVNGRSGKVPLASVARLVPGWQPAVIGRRNQRRTVSVGSQVKAGTLANAVTASLEPKVRELMKTMPPGSRHEIGGEQEQSVESQAKLMSAFALSALFILLVLISQYNSFVKPLVVLAAVPFSLIGALLALFLTGWALGFMPFLGLISLAGVVINNAIILIDFIETGIREGKPLRAAVTEAGRLRMRPIVLTTLTTVGGMLPLALFGGPLWAGMAWAVIGGLTVSTLLTLVMIPTLYALCVERFGLRIAGVDQADGSAVSS